MRSEVIAAMAISRGLAILRLALKTLHLHKLRSGLTILGVVFGVFSVIAMLAIGEGASQQAQQQVLQLGATNIIAVSVKPPQEVEAGSSRRGGFVLQYGLLRTDFDLLTSTIPTVQRAIPVRETTQEVRYGRRALNARVVGCTEDYRELNHLRLARGRFVATRDQHDAANVAVVAHEVATTLFPLEDPRGKAIQVGNRYYTIVGVTGHRTASAAVGGSLSGQEFNKDVYIPLRTFQVRIGDQIFHQGTGSFSAERLELNQITLQVADRAAVLPTAQVVRESLEQTHRHQRDFDVIVPLELLKQADQIRTIFNIVLGSIAAISLVVGGIGIMNIMLATVTERTREIGIRRALGARRRDITRQFLTETIVLAGTGGMVGIALGLLTPTLFSAVRYLLRAAILDEGGRRSEIGRIFAEMEPQVALWSLPLAFGIAVGIGVVFGLYPARAAAQMDPIEALRHD